MEFRTISDNKRDFLPLLLLGDEQEDMIARYLDRGTLWALYDGGLRCVCVVTEEGGGALRSKTSPWLRRASGEAMGGPWWSMWPGHTGAGERVCWLAPETAR